jgi:hypothetical protein
MAKALREDNEQTRVLTYGDPRRPSWNRPRDQAAMLGHTKINMVLRYAHPTQEHQTKAMDKTELYVSDPKIAYAERTAPQTSSAIQ